MTIVIELNQPNVMHLPNGGRLLPGQNNIDAKAWAKDKKHHVVKQWLDLNLITDCGEGTATPLAEDIGRVPVRKARLWIEHTTDLSVLMKWRNNENREGVKSYITARIESVKASQQRAEPVKQTVGDAQPARNTEMG